MRRPPAGITPTAKIRAEPCLDSLRGRANAGRARGHDQAAGWTIQYVANKIGGLHYDESRKDTDAAFKALDDLPQQIVWSDDGGFDLRYYEMLAVGQLVVTSPDVQEWMAEHRP